MKHKKTFKPVILHFIYNLSRGGAETILLNSVPHLKEYSNILVTLDGICQFTQELPFIQCVNLNSPSTLNIPKAVKRLRATIKKYHPVLVHSHLPLPNIIARIAVPKDIPLVSTIHTTVSQSVAYQKLLIRLLEKYSFQKRKSLIVGVSENVVNDYKSFFKIKNMRVKVLYNFTDEVRAGTRKIQSIDNKKVRMVSVGKIKSNKNYEYILNAILDLNNPNIELDIYGRGIPPEVYTKIKQKKLPVNFKGQIENVNDILSGYDVFISASKFEGFSLSVLEAMASNKVLLLSDIPSHREQCCESAIYFSLIDHNDLIKKIEFCISNKVLIKEKVALAYERFRNNYTLDQHISSLKKIYSGEIIQYQK